jgi:hypothetical protein
MVRLTLHDDRGLSASASSGDPWRGLTPEGVEADVRTTVLPDEADTQDEHPGSGLRSCSAHMASTCLPTDFGLFRTRSSSASVSGDD